MRIVLSVLLMGLTLLSSGTAHAQPEREPPQLTPEQEAHLMERRERLRMLRQEMLREMRPGETPAQPPTGLRPFPPGEVRQRATWEDGRIRRLERAPGEYPYRPPRVARPEWVPHEPGESAREREPGPNRLSPEERRQLRRQMREAAREVYGE